MRVEESGSRSGYHNRATTRRIGKVRANLGDQIVGDGYPVKHGGDEGGGPTKSVGQNDAVSDQHVVAVVPHN